METFLYQHDFKSLVKESSSFKNSLKHTTVDLILTNSSTYFQNTETFLIGLSDFHKLVFTILKISFPLEINYISLMKLVSKKIEKRHLVVMMYKPAMILKTVL